MTSNDDQTEWFNKTCKKFNGTCTMGNRVLVSEEKKIHVNSDFLSIHSEYFKTLFNGDFKEKNEEEIEITIATAAELQMFLQLIYPGRSEVTSENYKTLIDLSFRFLSPGVLDQCVSFIEKNIESLNKVDILEMAFKHNLKKLKDSVSKFLKEQNTTRNYICKEHMRSTDYCCQYGTPIVGYPIHRESFLGSNRYQITQLPAEMQAFILQAIINY